MTFRDRARLLHLSFECLTKSKIFWRSSLFGVLTFKWAIRASRLLPLHVLPVCFKWINNVERDTAHGVWEASFPVYFVCIPIFPCPQIRSLIIQPECKFLSHSFLLFGTLWTSYMSELQLRVSLIYPLQNASNSFLTLFAAIYAAGSLYALQGR